MSTKTKEKIKSGVDEITSRPYRLLLFNDSYNTFDWVITCLIKICGHDHESAQQCALIVHNNGKCDVKYGDKETISKMKEKLRNAGLSATMEAN